jgi:two-component system, cell cycle sensor histidine kinase and response regulator CckA
LEGTGTTKRQTDTRIPVGPRADGPRRVLVVDDEAGVCMLVRRILSGAGYEVLEAEDGRAAMHVLLDHAPTLSLVVSDLVMPVMSGHDLADFLRRYFPDIPLIMMSAYSAEAIRERFGLLAPEAPFLRKPFMPDDMLRAVRAVLGDEVTGAEVERS